MTASHYSRRKFVAALIAGCCLLSGGQALANPGVDSMLRNMPPLYKAVGPIPGEYRVVRLFFSSNCNFSRKFHDLLYKWGLSLPPDVKFLPTPILPPGDQASAAMATAFYAAWLADPKRLNAFIKESYSNVQSLRMDATRFETYFDAADRSGIDRARFKAALSSPALKKAGSDGMLVAAHYGVKSTPAIGIGGQFLVSPDGVAGSEELLIQLLNGLTSKMLIGD